MRKTRYLEVAAMALGLVVGQWTFGQEEKKFDGENPDYARERVEKGPVHRIKDLLGYNVVGARGEKFGEITEVVISIDDGRIAYGVLAYGGVLGIGSRMIAVPWNMLKLNPKDKTFTLSATQDQLDRAPTLDLKKLPSTAPSFPTASTPGSSAENGRKDQESPAPRK